MKLLNLLLPHLTIQGLETKTTASDDKPTNQRDRALLNHDARLVGPSLETLQFSVATCVLSRQHTTRRGAGSIAANGLVIVVATTITDDWLTGSM